MWTSTLDLDPRRVLLTRLIGRFWRDAYVSSFAPLCVQNMPRQPLPGTNWVRVRNRLAGICGSDLHLIYLDGDLRIAPAALPSYGHTYLGHEVVGDVIEIGEDVQTLAIGDRVVLQYGPNCLSADMQTPCRSCMAGNYNLCERGRLPGPKPVGGGWSEEMLLHEQQLYRISPTISDEQAVLIEPTAVALHAVLRYLPKAGDRVLIVGAGTIGLLTLQMIQTLAPQAEISVLARHSFQVEQATRMGAKHIIYPQDSYTGVQQATNAQLFRGMLGNQMLLGGFDVIYDTVGHRKTLHHALRWVRSRGTIVLVGLYLHMMHIDLTPIWHQEINLVGMMSHGLEHWPLSSDTQRSTFSIVEELIKSGALHPEHLITHHFALDKYQQALVAASRKVHSRAIKVVFDYSLQPASVVPNVRASARRRRTPLSTPTKAPFPLQAPAESPVEPSIAALPIPPTPIFIPEYETSEEDTAKSIPIVSQLKQFPSVETTDEPKKAAITTLLDAISEPIASTEPPIEIPEPVATEAEIDPPPLENELLPEATTAHLEMQETPLDESLPSDDQDDQKNIVTKDPSEALVQIEKPSTTRAPSRPRTRKKK